jgi:hypothetical protein
MKRIVKANLFPSRVSKIKRIELPWSYSRWSSWEQCNAKAGYRHGDGIQEPRGPALIRGGETHEAIEAYAAFWKENIKKSEITPGIRYPKLPPHVDYFKKRIDWMIEQGCVFEQRWFIDINGQIAGIRSKEEPRPSKKSYWLEVGTDVHLPPKKKEKVLYIWDFKTGRLRNYDNQKEIYAMAGMIVYPQVEKVICENLYLDENETSLMVYHTDSFDRLWKKWQDNVGRMLADRIFRPNPSRLCNWCGYSKFKGGPCQAAQE